MNFYKLLIKLIPIKKIRKEFRQILAGTLPVTISERTRCLMIAPHPDDEVIGCGGIMTKYAKHFDCICMASSGVAFGEVSAETRADMRIACFTAVMDNLGIQNRWIFKTYGIPFMIDQIEAYFDEYAKVLNFAKYDYIFMPSPIDNHPEHQFIVDDLIKRLMRKNEVKNTAKIVFYEVWTPITRPSYYEDISSVMDAKKKLIGCYKSSLGKIDYVRRTEGLNCYRGVFANNCDFAEAYQVISVQQYLAD